MRLTTGAVLAMTLGMTLGVAAQAKKSPALPPDSLYRLKTKSLEGKDVDLKDYAGKVVLIVNLASQ